MTTPTQRVIEAARDIACWHGGGPVFEPLKRLREALAALDADPSNGEDSQRTTGEAEGLLAHSAPHRGVLDTKFLRYVSVAPHEFPPVGGSAQVFRFDNADLTITFDEGRLAGVEVWMDRPFVMAGVRNVSGYEGASCAWPELIDRRVGHGPLAR